MKENLLLKELLEPERSEFTNKWLEHLRKKQMSYIWNGKVVINDSIVGLIKTA